MTEFHGWVPTVTGNLSFATIGNAPQPRKVGIARTARHDGFVLVAQARRTTDAQPPVIGDALNWFSKKDGYSTYILFGRSYEKEKHKKLHGSCILFAAREYNRLKESFSKLLDKNLDDEDFLKLFEEKERELLTMENAPSRRVSKIELARDGKIEITFEGNKDDEVTVIASQIFFFIRDASHIHQHHDPTSDTILDVASVSEDKNQWKRDTLYSLYRWIIRRKRSKEISAYIDAKGVLAYARAFEEKHCSGMETSEAFPEYSWEATRDSIDAGLFRLEYQEKTKGFHGRFIFTRLLPMAAFILLLLRPFYGALPSDATWQEQTMADVINWLNGNIIFVLVACFALFLMEINLLRFLIKISRLSILIDAYRLLMMIPFGWVIAILTFFMLSLIAFLGIYFF